jgi:predicted amidohydrolase
MNPVTVAAVQAAPVLADRDATVAKVIALAEQVAAEGARLVVFPEAFVPGYPDWVWRSRPWDATSTELYGRLLGQAVVAGSPASRRPAETARRLGIWLSRGNSVIGGPEGEILAGPLTGEDGIIFADIDAAAARTARQQFDPVGHDRRSDLLRLTVDAMPRAAVSFRRDEAEAVPAPPDEAGVTS